MRPVAPRYRKVFRDLTSHWFRTLLVVLSIAIGIFAVGVMLGGREILLREFDADHASSVPANVTYRTMDFSADLVQRAADEPGVEAAQARRSASLRYVLEGTEGERSITLEAFDDFDAIEVGKVVPLDEAPWPPADGEIVLEASAKIVDDYAVGDVLRVETAEGDVLELELVGFAHDINAMPAKFVGHETGYVTLNTMEDLGETREFNSLSLTFTGEDLTWSGASRRAVDIRGRLFEDENVTVFYTDVPEPGSHFLGDIFNALSLLLLALGGLALGLSAFLVVNTVSALMAQQVRQVGIMKAIGGSAGQLERLYAVIVTMYGLIACAVGLPLTAAGTQWFTDYAAGMLNFRVTSYAPPVWVVLVEIAVGMLVPLLAASRPVRNGVRMSVVRALNGAGMSTSHFGHGLVDRVLGMIRGLPRPVALSLRNTFLRKGRLALTLSTLVLASAVVMAVWSVRASIEHTIDDLETWWGFDVQLTLAMPQSAEDVVAEAEGVRGVEAAEAWPVLPAALMRDDGSENESFAIVGLDPETDFVEPNIVEGRWLEPDDTDAVVINTDAQNAESILAVGETVTLGVAGAEGEWRVVGVVKGQLGGPALYCNEEYLAEVVGELGATRVLVRSESSEDADELLVSVEDALNDAGHQVTSATTRAELASQLREWLGILVAFLVLMATLLAAVGVIGLTGTMSINVLESTREIGVMRATGAQHKAIYQIYVTEGVTVGVIAWFLGALLTYPISYALVLGLETAIGIPLTYTFSWWGLAGWLGLMLAISAFASLAPAFRASQVSVRDAISYE
ncbi:MAG: ABC transporter permease [Coriobacteriia bacterium]